MNEYIAFLLGIVLVELESIIGMPTRILYILAILACGFTVYSFLCYLLVKENWRPFLKIIAIVNNGDVSVREIADYVIEVPETLELLSPLLTTIPLQLLSYHIAVMRECNVDQPRNLAKSVTVE